jgi:NAD(P)-dependent dehydrogenase (short-subunit alcohol dehydrogenase family)
MPKKMQEGSMDQLKGRKIVIMGGTSGIGLASAQRLVSRGASVIVNAERADRTRQQNPELIVEIADASSSDGLAGFYRAVGPFSDLVLCVSGAKGAGTFREVDIAELREGFDEKLFAQFRAAQAALPFLRKDGSLTFISAISARAANPGTAGLAAINGAIEAMVKPLARELRPLRVNAISPGAVETPWWDRLPREIRDSLLQQTASASLVGRNGSAEEIGRAVEFIVTNGFVSGTVLEVDGGLHLA